MKSRFSYPLLFLLPSTMLAALMGLVFAAGMAGIAWIFIFGDNTWPEAAGTVIMLVASAVAIATMAGALIASYLYGKRQETLGGLDRRHAVGAAVLTLVVLGLWVLLIQ